MRTEAAKTSSAIKSELKKAFPKTKFSVRSSNFSGGDSVSIRYENGAPRKEIEKITDKYQAGSFDGMTDCYDYDNKIEGIPQAKYIQVMRTITDEKKEEAKQRIIKKYGITEWNDKAIMAKFNIWPNDFVYKELEDKTL